MSRRTERVASTVRDELAAIMLQELNDPRLTGMPSITRVKVSPDLSQADVYVTIMGTPGQQSAALNALKHSAGMMRTRLTKALTLRVAPFIKFHMDEQVKREIAVLDLIRLAAAETAEVDRKRAAAASEAGDAVLPETPATSHTPSDTSSDTSGEGNPGLGATANDNPGIDVASPLTTDH